MSEASAQANELLLEYVIRPMLPEDLAWVARSWKLSLRFGPQYRRLPPNKAFATINTLVDALLESPHTGIIVACDAREDVQTLFGFLAHTGSVLHYVQTRRHFRRNGICRALMEHVEPPLERYTTHSQHDAIFDKAGLVPMRRKQ